MPAIPKLLPTTYAPAGATLSARRAMWLWFLTGVIPAAHIVAENDGEVSPTTRRSSYEKAS